jgi:predicted nuclease of predicted toxin-antitoxin system
MRFLVDVQLPPALAEWIRSKGFTAEHVYDDLGARSPDTLIAETSIEIGAIVVSKDKDFLRLQQNGRPQVVWVRIGNTTNRVLFDRFEAEWPRVLADLTRGESVVELL